MTGPTSMVLHSVPGHFGGQLWSMRLQLRLRYLREIGREHQNGMINARRRNY
jgi:hypothetical protein